MLTAFVAGATGYTGREVVECLVRRGARVIAHVRPESPRAEEFRARFASLGAVPELAPWTPEAMAASMAAHTPSIVFSLLGTTRRRVKESGGKDTYEAVDVGLSLMLLKAVATLAPPPRFVYLSSAGVSSAASGSYLRARWTVESEIRTSGIPYTIARPSFISGPDRDETRPGERAVAASVDVGLAVLGFLGARGLRARWSSTTGAQLAEALVRAALDPAAAGRVLESELLRV